MGVSTQTKEKIKQEITVKSGGMSASEEGGGGEWEKAED